MFPHGMVARNRYGMKHLDMYTFNHILSMLTPTMGIFSNGTTLAAIVREEFQAIVALARAHRMFHAQTMRVRLFPAVMLLQNNTAQQTFVWPRLMRRITPHMNVGDFLRVCRRCYHEDRLVKRSMVKLAKALINVSEDYDFQPHPISQVLALVDNVRFYRTNEVGRRLAEDVEFPAIPIGYDDVVYFESMVHDAQFSVRSLFQEGVSGQTFRKAVTLLISTL
jgi:hypothetical protein